VSNTQSGRRLSFTDPQYKYSVEGIQTTHTTITGLVAGVTYKFVVQSRNVIGYSEYSQSIQVQAAQVPDAPTLLSNNPAITSA